MKHHLKLRDWIDIDKLCWDGLSRNENNVDKNVLSELSTNRNAIDLLERKFESFGWSLPSN